MTTFDCNLLGLIQEYNRTHDQDRAITALVTLEPEMQQYLDDRRE